MGMGQLNSSREILTFVYLTSWCCNSLYQGGSGVTSVISKVETWMAIKTKTWGQWSSPPSSPSPVSVALELERLRKCHSRNGYRNRKLFRRLTESVDILSLIPHEELLKWTRGHNIIITTFLYNWPSLFSNWWFYRHHVVRRWIQSSSPTYCRHCVFRVNPVFVHLMLLQSIIDWTWCQWNDCTNCSHLHLHHYICVDDDTACLTAGQCPHCWHNSRCECCHCTFCLRRVLWICWRCRLNTTKWTKWWTRNYGLRQYGMMCEMLLVIKLVQIFI